MTLKVLVTTSAGTGHIHPMVPLARALVARGHDVLWALPDRSVGHVVQAGLQAVGVTAVPPVQPPEVLLKRFPVFGPKQPRAPEPHVKIREVKPAEPRHVSPSGVTGGRECTGRAPDAYTLTPTLSQRERGHTQG